MPSGVSSVKTHHQIISTNLKLSVNMGVPLRSDPSVKAHYQIISTNLKLPVDMSLPLRSDSTVKGQHQTIQANHFTHHTITRNMEIKVITKQRRKFTNQKWKRVELGIQASEVSTAPCAPITGRQRSTPNHFISRTVTLTM